MIREQLTNSVRLSINTLIINRVHSRDVIKNMLQAGIEKASDFLWNIQMRYDFVEQVSIEEEDRKNERIRLEQERHMHQKRNPTRRKSSRYALSDTP